MKKIIILLACLLVLIPQASARVVYQENAAASACSDKYVLLNYTQDTAVQQMLWHVKYGEPLLDYNVTLSQIYYTQSPIQLRLVSDIGSPLFDPAYSYGQGYNGSAWNNVTNISSSTYGSSTGTGAYPINCDRAKDGDWGTDVYHATAENWRASYSGGSLYARLYEDGLYYIYAPQISIQSPENKTYMTNSIPLNWSSDTTLTYINYSLDGGTNITVPGNLTSIPNLYGGFHNITLYGTDTFGNTNSTTQYFQTTEGIININVYDEESPTTPILSNLTITNGTTTLTYTNVSSKQIYMEDIRGTLTITAHDYAGNYSQRQISATMESGQNKTENIYLLLDSAGFQIDLNVYDSLSTGITGALVNISRQSGYNYNYVTECTTDSAGYCFVTLNDTATYKFVVSKSGYVTKTQYITPTLTAYSFTLQTPTPSINFTSELGGVTMLLTPQITALKKSDAQSFNFTITSNETLTSWGMQILWQNYTGTSLFTSTQSAAYGGSVNATINTTLYNGTVVVRTFLQRDGYSLRSYYTNYTIHTITPYNHSLYNLIPDVQTNYGGTFSNLFITVALLLFIVFAAALFGLGTEVSGALLFIGLGYLSYFGLIPFNLLLLAMILFMSYLLWKG